MSTLKAQNLQNPSAGSPAIVLASDGTATAQLSSVNGGPLAGARNRVINGGFEIAQRGTSGISGYQLDRWLANNTSAQSQSSDAPSGFINSIEFTSSSAAFPYIEQRIERVNSYDLAGQTVTLSFWAKSVSGTSNLYVEVYRANSNDNFSAVTFETGQQAALTPSTSWTRYTISLTLSASATTGLAVRIIRNNASAASTRVAGVQLEAGSAATPFERRSYGQELSLCQRYYEVGACWIIGFGNTNGFIGSAQNFNSSKRVNNPSVTLGTPTENVNFASIGAPAVYGNGFRLYGAITTGTSINAYYTNTFLASAEL